MTSLAADPPTYEAATEEIRYLRARLAFSSARAGFSGVSTTDWDALANATQWRLLTNGEAELRPSSLQRPAAPRQQVDQGSTNAGQVGGGREVFDKLTFNGTRPVWSADLVRAMQHAQHRRAGGLSPHAYPHAASDVATALRSFALDNTTTRNSRAQESLGVFSSITPWVELTLLQVYGRRAHQIVTVDYNPPVVDANDLSAALGTHLPLRAMHASALGEHYARGRLSFDLIVAFSGIEHDGLGRCARVLSLALSGTSPITPHLLSRRLSPTPPVTPPIASPVTPPSRCLLPHSLLSDTFTAYGACLCIWGLLMHMGLA